jgi:hypothetical protein
VLSSTTGSCGVVQALATGGGAHYDYPYGTGYTGTVDNWTPIGAADPARPDLPFMTVMDEGGRFTLMLTGRSHHTATSLEVGPNAGMVLLAGGYSATTQLYNPTSVAINGVPPGQYADGPVMTTARTFATATRLSDGWVLIAGGQDAAGAGLSSAELYNPTTNTFSLVPSALSSTRWRHTASVMAGDHVLLAGGYGASATPVASTDIFTYNAVTHTGSFAAGPAMAAPRAGHAAATLADGLHVLVTGGWGTTALTPAQVYDQGGNAFTSAGAMNVARAAHTATLLPSGRVLIAGGTVVDGSAPALVSEIYDGGASMAVAGSTLAAEDHQAVLLDTGKILLVGGHDHAGTALAITQVFDPVSQSFSAAADTAVARDGATATRLVDGSVLIAGGDGPNASAWLTSERFSPATDVIAPGHTGTPFNVTLAGFGAASNSFTIKSGALPPGLALNSATRQIAGTPTATGVYRVVVEIGDSSNLVRTVLRTVTIQIN